MVFVIYANEIFCLSKYLHSTRVTAKGGNGLGDRLSQKGVNYTLDLNAGLTQVLSDGTNQYLYGVGRIAQVNTTTLITDYFMTDALGSVRQLTDAQGEITLVNAYEPYGILAQTAGIAQTSYGFTGEFTDPSGMVYLRARYYSPNDGRFLTRDTWMGDYNNPLSLNRWMYVGGNPINFTDPSGYSPVCDNGDWDDCGIPDWWKRRSHLYVEGYGYLDTGHLQRGWGSAKWIEESIDALVGGGEIHLASKEGQPPKEIYWVDYYVTANIKTLDRAQKTSVMYGIYTDFERGYENYQLLHRVDRFPSAFSREDLPSDHLGFWAYHMD